MFETYQTFFTGLLGFAGVILTLIINGMVQRSTRKNELLHQANSIRTAIKSELLMNKGSYELRIEQFGDKTNFKDTLLPSKIYDKIYNKLIDKIGLLEEIEIEKVLHAYHLMLDLPYKLRIMVGTDRVGGIDKEWIRLNENEIPITKEMHEKFLPIIEAAIDTLDAQLKKA